MPPVLVAWPMAERWKAKQSSELVPRPEIFGWKILQEMDMGPMGTYRIFGLGERRLGGMMTTPKGSPMPPVWLYYTETSDLDAAIGRATKSGAKIMNGPMDVPGGGRIAQLTDPQGAAFALHQSPKK